MTKLNYYPKFQFALVQMRKTLKEHMSIVMCAHNVALLSSMQVWELEVIYGILTTSSTFLFTLSRMFEPILKSTSTLVMFVGKTCKVGNVCPHNIHNIKCTLN